MMHAQPNQKRKMLLKTAVLAACSAGIYTALFANEATVTQYFTRGNIYAALPVLTAFAFSVIHGAFASQCLEALGITAKKTPAARVETSQQKQKAVRKDQRPRLEVR
jgi:hypothetical protein